MTTIRALLRQASDQLAAAGVPSPDVDARELLAHVLGVSTSRLLLVDSARYEQQQAFETLVARRVDRVPLQHLTGVAYFRYAEIKVGPGVFVPRPETEVMTGWAIDRIRELIMNGVEPVVVELCAGSGAISRAIADEAPGCRQYAVEVSEEAVAWAEGNLTGTGVDLRVGDMASAFPELDGSVDLVIANPPYIPLEAYESVTPEVRDHDPMVALFSGDDGLDAMRVVAEVGARLLHGDGLLCAEHAEVQEDSAVAVFVENGGYREVRDQRDLADRPRFVTAVRRRLAGLPE